MLARLLRRLWAPRNDGHGDDRRPSPRPPRSLAARPCRGVSRAGCRRALRRRPVEPELPARRRLRALRAAAQAARAAIAERACGRSRVPGHAGAGRDAGAGAAGPRAVRGRRGDRQRLLCDGISRRPHLLGPAAAGDRRPGRARRDVRLDERGHRRPAQRRLRRRSGSAISAGPATTWAARSRAGAGSTAPPRPRRSRRWTG